VDEIARRRARRYGDRAGFGIAIYAGGKQLACRVSLRPPDETSLEQLLDLVRSELPGGGGKSVMLLSLLDEPWIVSVDEYAARGIRIGHDTVATVRDGHVTLILAHVACFMSWNSRQLGEALLRKQGGARALELHVFPTETVWLDERGRGLPCRGGLRARGARLGSSAGLRGEIGLVAGYLRCQLSATEAIDYAYDPWRDASVPTGSPARKAIAIAALVRAARLLGDARGAEQALQAFARLRARRAPVGDIDDAHLLLASTTDPYAAAVKQVRVAVRESGVIVAPGADDQDYFPGVALTALASHGALSEAEAARSLHHYRRRFRAEPSWPALWWHLRAWSTIAQVGPAAARDFVFELADWALGHQLPSGAFDTWSWPVAPSFQSVCVVEGLLGAVGTARRAGDRPRAERYLAAARRGLRFSSSLVLDSRHADLLPRPARALGGVRAWHGELILRADVAGHYLAALTGLAELTEGE
jgi:hypothetical protein